MATYRHYLTIVTSRVNGGGTDEKVKLFFSVDGIVIGGTITIDGAGGRFESGDADVFFLDSPYSLHAAEKVGLRITNLGTNAPDWFCYSVKLERAGWSKTFLVRDWIRPGENYKTYPQYIGEGVEAGVAILEVLPEGTTIEGVAKLESD